MAKDAVENAMVFLNNSSFGIGPLWSSFGIPRLLPIVTEGATEHTMVFLTSPSFRINSSFPHRTPHIPILDVPSPEVDELNNISQQSLCRGLKDRNLLHHNTSKFGVIVSENVQTRKNEQSPVRGF